ncbi:helix-turn-helix domain-containing protein [Halocatena salina]|uniref:Helix-turn-helix domain-containing protein n=1 Tax=Halocatena salina TaxID=2934340 RepID=A0A8U0AAI7_9EURY|nr:helix-turn-helix domain-containing protein [Halocatena salina]UPM44953.1 helix-turn-helix domain-containing protein [Halocatena salina]
MPAIRMAVTPPVEYLTELPVDSSTASVHILALCDLDDRARGILEIRPPDDELQSVVRFLTSREAIVSAEVLYADADIGLIQYTTREEPTVYFAALEAGATPVFPVEIRNGQLLIEGFMAYDRLSRFEEALEQTDALCDIRLIKQPPNMDALKHSPNVDDLLTARQQQFILEAVKWGYYDTPRHCTLTELAESLNVTKGAASGLLHRAEEQIVKEFVENLSGTSVEI